MQELKREILVFSTSIQSRKEVEHLKEILECKPGVLSWNVDMDDWEKILRVESSGIHSSEIIEIGKSKGIVVRELI